MNPRQGSRPPFASRNLIGRLSTAIALVLALLSVSCGGNSSSHATHNAYISLTSADSVALFHITDSSGALSSVSNSVPLVGTGPVGLALHPSGKFLYAANSIGNSVSTFNVSGDGTLTQAGNPIPAGTNPQGAVIDPSGKFLLVANADVGANQGSISIFSIDSGTGALTPMTPFTGLFGPTKILMTSSGFVYVLTPSTNAPVNGFTLSASGTLTPTAGSPYAAGHGTSDMAINPAEQFLYVTNTADNDVNGFTINPDGSLTPMGFNFTQTNGIAPAALAVDTTGKFLYVSSLGSSSSIWVFSITAGGILDPNISGSPFNLAGGNTFVVMEPGGKYFYVGNSGGHDIAAYSYDASTGVPTAITGSPFSVGNAFSQLLITH